VNGHDQANDDTQQRQIGLGRFIETGLDRERLLRSSIPLPGIRGSYTSEVQDDRRFLACQRIQLVAFTAENIQSTTSRLGTAGRLRRQKFAR